MSDIELNLVTSTAPESLTPARALVSARALRPHLIAEQAETERRTFHSEELHLRFVEAGFYHLLRPRMFGGYEFDVPSFFKVICELARGCMSTAWCLCLASAHNLQVASWFPERTQRDVYAGDGHVAVPMTAAPGGTLARGEGGWVLDSLHPYSSGAPYATHFVGHAFIDTGADGAPGPMSTFIAPRDAWTMLDTWGDSLGLKGSGSHSLRFENVTLPEHWVLEGKTQLDMPVGDGTPGLELHGNPMYGGRALGFFSSEAAFLTIGAAWAALDEYAELITTRDTVRPPIVRRVQHPTYQEWYGQAVSRLTAAEAIADRAAHMYMEVCVRAAEGGKPFTLEDDVLINMVASEGLAMAWKTVEDIILPAAGTSAAASGQRFERTWRDLCMAWGHVNTVMRSWMARDYTREHFGISLEETAQA